MLKQVENRVSGLMSVTRRWLYHHNNPQNVGTRFVEAQAMKSQRKIDDETAKMVEDYFKAGVRCRTLVGYQPNLKIEVDDNTGRIVNVTGFENNVCWASSYFTTESGKGEQMEEALSIKNQEIARHFSLTPFSMLACDAIKAAVKDYEAKKAKFNEHTENADDA